MAASCRRLANLLRRNWCSIHAARGQPAYYLTTSSYKVSSSTLAICSVSSSVCPRHRWLATKAIDSAESIDKEPGFFSRFWRWFNDEEQEEVMGETERREREEMLQRVQAMYFANPPVAPGLDFYKEAFELLMKYDDGLGVETLWNFMKEMNVAPDAELESKIKPFLEKARRNVWFE